MVWLTRAIEAFLGSARVARLATVDRRGRPHVVPIVFAYAAGRLYTPIDLKPKAAEPARLRRVRNIRSNPHVQVLIDRYDEDWGRLGYVQLRGRAELIERGAEYRRALRLLESKYPQYEALPLEGRPVIRVTIERVVSWGRVGAGVRSRQDRQPGSAQAQASARREARGRERPPPAAPQSPRRPRGSRQGRSASRKR